MQIRRAARTVIFDENNRVAILEVQDGAYHKIPGGGIESNETEELAAIREAIEEAGCDTELMNKLGELEFIDPDHNEMIHHSVCFLARKIKEHKTTNFTEHEIKNRFRLTWLNIDEAVKLFKALKSAKPFEIAMNNRDLEFLILAKKYLK